MGKLIVFVVGTVAGAIAMCIWNADEMERLNLQIRDLQDQASRRRTR